MRRVEDINESGDKTYQWQKTPGQRSDWPFCFTGETLVKTYKGDIPIKDIKVGDFVLTRYGYKRVVWSGMTQRDADVVKINTNEGNVICTRDHKFYTQRGFDKVNVGDTIYLCKRNTYTLMDTTLSDTQTPPKEHIGSISAPQSKNIKLCCIDIFMQKNTGKFLKDLLSTIKTKIRWITHWIIYVSCQRQNTKHCMENCCGKKQMLSRKEKCKRKCLQIKTGIGIVRKLAEKPCPSELKSKCLKKDSSFVQNVVKKQKSSKIAEQDFVHKNAKEDYIDENGMKNTPDILRTTIVNGILKIGKRNVYDIEVEDAHEFFANDFLVHNCMVFWRVGMGYFMEDKVTFADPSNPDFAFRGMEVDDNNLTRFNPRLIF